MTPETAPGPPRPEPRGRDPLQPSDAEVVRRVLAGETALFELLMRRNNPRVYRAIRGILRDEAEVEDAMQQAYLKAYTSLRDFEGASAFSTWLVRIAVNEALARIRKGAHLEVVGEVPDRSEDTMSPPRETPEERAAAHESMRLVERAVDRLPLAYRSVFMLREIEEMTTAEVAQTLGLSEEAVKVRLHRARRALRDVLEEELERGAPEAFPFHAPRCDRVVAAVMARIRGEHG